MVLLIDVGNSNIVLGLAEDGQIQKTFRLKSVLSKTSDEYYFQIRPILEAYPIQDIIISSVVPIITSALKKVFVNHYGTTPLIMGPGIKTGVQLKVDDPKTVGADIICDVAALKGLADEAIIVDLGTATKYIYQKNQVFHGVSIAPGITISMQALVNRAALLPSVELICPKKVIGTNTITSIQSGVLFGAASQVDGMINRIKEELNQNDLKVYATGGLAGLIVPLCKNELIHLKDLTLQGLLKIYELNQKEQL
ncbi:MAG TPA: type III pantothenate kinase [Candidatus Pelethenecus faecipullorum]|uniref:Type III pantothenate kinase n=1 Tax=Candidatus Pelethenecus faecipullorum TaxID=2840900 RepID=A0A9D1GRF4_9MOLU|nr:type III pantothenate kinase [Candidatus Pelethenecus faecipullorum]